MPKGNLAKQQALTDMVKLCTVENPGVFVEDEELYLALYVTDPGGGNTGTEASYTGYERQLIEFGEPAMNSSVAEILNTNLIEFETVDEASGSIGYAAILTGQTGGSIIYYDSLGATYLLSAGVKPTVPIGGLAVYEN